ncbi:MAG: NAD(+) diphosphatase [Gammaproteobacteria bacterium]|nr:NAD(+) diphosphatase [Gammaproteobacteria bacterium]
MKSNLFEKKYHTVDSPNDNDFIFVFKGADIYLIERKKLPNWHAVSNYFNQGARFYCFSESNQSRYLISENTEINDDSNFFKVNLRSTWTILDDVLFSLARNANHLHYWRKTHHYCGNCGHKNSDKVDEQALICLSCQHVTYPRISPCIIVLITNGNKILLARSPHFPPKIYSTLAGFIEPGESLEEALHREVKEEVGVTISGLTYFGSQPWPFPDSLMIGFHASYLAGEIKIDEKEIEDAQWFDIDNLPELPQKLSVGRALIDSYIATFQHSTEPQVKR